MTTVLCICQDSVEPQSHAPHARAVPSRFAPLQFARGPSADVCHVAGQGLLMDELQSLIDLQTKHGVSVHSHACRLPLLEWAFQGTAMSAADQRRVQRAPALVRQALKETCERARQHPEPSLSLFLALTSCGVVQGWDLTGSR